LKAVACCFVAVVIAAMAFAIFEPIQVLPRFRLAPGYSLVADDGSAVTSEDGRGTVTLYSFAPMNCDSRCDAMFETMRVVERRVGSEVDFGDTEFRLVTIALDGDGPEGLADAAARSGADGRTWRWVGGDERSVRNVVAVGFERYYEVDDAGAVSFDPGFVLVDGNGVIRGEYRYQTLASDADKFIRHFQILADEVRNAEGAVAVAYEAAHLFLCYP
jgi:protein SCO1/2